MGNRLSNGSCRQEDLLAGWLVGLPARHSLVICATSSSQEKAVINNIALINLKKLIGIRHQIQKALEVFCIVRLVELVVKCAFF